MPKNISVGVVTSDKMTKTRRVEIPRLVRHAKYGKIMRRKTVCHVHDETEETGALANMLAALQYPDAPVPLGVFRAVKRPAYHEAMYAQIEDAKKAGGEPDLNKLIRGPKTWTVS